MPDVTPAELAEALDSFRLQVTVEGCYDLSGHKIGITHGTVTDPSRAAHALHRELGAYAARTCATTPDATGSSALAEADAEIERLEHAQDDPSALLRQVETARDEAMAECARLAGLLAAARGEHEAFLTIKSALEGERDEARALVRDILQSLPDTADEPGWRDRAGAAGVTDPDGQPYRAWTEEDL